MRYLMLIVILQISCATFSQILKPGFSKEEYKELMYVSTRSTANPDYYNKFPEPADFKMVYQSQPIGLDNLWDFWVSEDKRAVISIRGTTSNSESWLANFYAAMVPAKGKLQLPENKEFNYELALSPKAAVHVGWLLSTAYLSEEIVPKIKEYYQQGIKDVVITGHSQGGAISFLLTAHLYGLQRNNELPADIRFKTYCSAAPKPGNLYFAYEYEAMTAGGWAFNVVNAADWVPETPISIQAVNDFSEVNPFVNAKSAIKKQKFPKNMVLRHVYNQLEKPTRKAQKKYERYLGKMTSKIISETIEGYVAPEFYQSNHYVRTGTTIVLLPDEEYYIKYPNDPAQIFIHHPHPPYLELLERLPD